MFEQNTLNNIMGAWLTVLAFLALSAITVLLPYGIYRYFASQRQPVLTPTPALPATPTPPPCSPWGRVRQVLRRWSWLLLFLAGLGLYPVQIYWQVRYAASQAASGDAAQAAAAEAAKVVDPALVFSKFSLALGVFCLINLLAWGALNMVLPVLADWAKGRYGEAEAAAAVGVEGTVPGMKRTFLGLPPLWRILIFFLGFALQVYAAEAGIRAAFTIQ